MIIKIKNQENLRLPVKNHRDDSCFDVYAFSDPKVVGEPAPNQENLEDLDKTWKSIQYLEYPTNLYFQPEPEFKGGKWKYYDILGYPRSSISNTNLILKNSVSTIDLNFTGQYIVKFAYILNDVSDFQFCVDASGAFCGFFGFKINKSKIYRKDQKIVQIRPSRVYNVDFDVVPELNITTRGAGSFGSTGL